MEKGGEGLPVTVRKESKETISGPLSLLSSSIVSVAAAYISSMRWWLVYSKAFGAPLDPEQPI